MYPASFRLASSLKSLASFSSSHLVSGASGWALEIEKAGEPPDSRESKTQRPA